MKLNQYIFAQSLDVDTSIEGFPSVIDFTQHNDISHIDITNPHKNVKIKFAGLSGEVIVNIHPNHDYNSHSIEDNFIKNVDFDFSGFSGSLIITGIPHYLIDRVVNKLGDFKNFSIRILPTEDEIYLTGKINYELPQNDFNYKIKNIDCDTLKLLAKDTYIYFVKGGSVKVKNVVCSENQEVSVVLTDNIYSTFLEKIAENTEKLIIQFPDDLEKFTDDSDNVSKAAEFLSKVSNTVFAVKQLYSYDERFRTIFEKILSTRYNKMTIEDMIYNML